MLEILKTGGPVLWVLAAAALAAAILFIVQMLHLRRSGPDVADLLNGIKNLLEGGRADEAVSLCEDTPGPAAKVLRAAIQHRGADTTILRESMEAAGHAETSRLERRLVPLSAIAYLAPMLGLLGTFLGILDTLVAVSPQADMVQAADLTRGLLNALYASIGGLLVAIPSYIMYSVLIVRTDRLTLDIERAASEILAFLSGHTPHPPRGT